MTKIDHLIRAAAKKNRWWPKLEILVRSSPKNPRSRIRLPQLPGVLDTRIQSGAKRWRGFGRFRKDGYSFQEKSTIKQKELNDRLVTHLQSHALPPLENQLVLFHPLLCSGLNYQTVPYLAANL